MEHDLTPSWFVNIDWTAAAQDRRAAADRYLLERPIGRGGFGEVWRAMDPTSATPLAIKVLVQEVARNARFQGQLRKEIRAVARLDHPNIVRLVDVGTLSQGAERATDGRVVAGSPFVAMEFIDGLNLSTWAAGTKGTPPDWPQLEAVADKLLDALAHAHARGVVHLDVKPSNVLLRHQDASPVLMDFGIAWLRRDDRAPEQGGTLAYAAPEQLIGDARDVGPASDLFAFGAMFWELLTGAPPFTAATPEERAFASLPAFRPRVDVPEHVESWLRQLLAPQPRQRFAATAFARRALGQSQPPSIADALRITAPRRPTGPLGLGLWGVGEVPFVGREAQRAQLRNHAEEAARGHAQTVVLTGPEGAGKTRLAEWVLEHLAAAGLFTTFRVRGDRGETLGDTLRKAFRLEGLSVERATRRLAPELDDPWLAGAAAEVLLNDETHRPLAKDTASPQLLHRFLEALAEKRPVALLFDECAAPPLSGRLLVLRTESEEGMHGSSEAEHRLALDPLSDAARQQLFDVLRLGQGPRQALGTQHAWPEWLLSQVAHWADAGRLKPDAGGIDFVSRAAQNPTGDLWQHRLDALSQRLSEGELRALEVAAFLPNGFPLEAWARAAEQVKAIPSLAALDRVAMEGLGRFDGQRFAFSSEALRRPLQERAGHRRTAIHRACGQALNHFAHPRDAEAAASHLLEAGAITEALPVLRRAAEARLRALDAQGAAALLATHDAHRNTVADSLPSKQNATAQIDSLCLGSAVSRALGDLPGAETLAAQAHRLSRELDVPLLRARCAHQRARVLRALGRHQEALRLLLEAEKWAEGNDDELQAACLADQGALLLRLGAHTRAERRLAQAISTHQSPGRKGLAMLLLARTVRRGGDPTRAAAIAEDAFEVLHQAGRRGLLPEAWRELGSCHRDLGRPSQAAGLFVRALQGYVSLGSEAATPCALNLGLCLLDAGDLEDAVAHLRGAISVWQGQNDPRGPGWNIALALAAVQAEAWDQCQAFLEATRPLDDDDWRRLARRVVRGAEDAGRHLLVGSLKAHLEAN